MNLTTKLCLGPLYFLICFLPSSFAAVDVGFKNGDFIIGTELGDGTVSFALCPDNLPEVNTKCFAISSCEFSETKLRKAISGLEEDAFRNEMERLLLSSYLSEFDLRIFVPKQIKILKTSDKEGNCVFVTDLERRVFPEKKKKSEQSKDK